MAIEAGAKNGIFPVDDKTLAYLEGRTDRKFEAVEADPDAVYEREIVIDLDTLQPTVAMPHLPSNTKTVGEVAGMPIDQVVIGSCTNGRISDMRAAAEILKGRKVADGMRVASSCPPPQEIVQQMHRMRACFETFLAAGCCRLHPHLRPLPGWSHGSSCAKASAACPPPTAIS